MIANYCDEHQPYHVSAMPNASVADITDVVLACTLLTRRLEKLANALQARIQKNLLILGD